MKCRSTIGLLLAVLFYSCLRANAQNASGVVNSYYQVTAINPPINSVTVDDATGLYPGQRVLLIQMKGATINSANASTYGDIAAIGDAGNYEFGTICTINGNAVTLMANLLNSYDPTGNVQLVSVPSYGSVIISGTVSASAWDPTTGKGGVVAISAANTIFLNADINVSGQGFLGGALINYPVPPFDCSWAVAVDNYYLAAAGNGDYTGGMKGEGITPYILNEESGMGKLANGGGGGNNTNTGGAGGGNYGVGGAGGQRAGESFLKCHGQYPGIGGAGLSAFGYSAGNNKIFLGGGGGSGHENNGVGLPGANGGGIIILDAPTIVGGGGQLLASGLAPLNPTNTDPTQAEGDGGGGGGAGGTIILNATSITGSIVAQAMGGNGSNSSNRVDDCTGPGGGGAGGVVWAAGAGFPSAVSASLTGGANGVVSSGNSLAACKGLSNGATAGSAGVGLTSYVLPQSTANTCVVLALSPLNYFTGREENAGALLSWGVNSSSFSAAGITSFTIERSVDQVHFTLVSTVPASGSSSTYEYTDPTDLPGTVFYRLVWVDAQGVTGYSSIVAISRPMSDAVQWLTLQPNPVVDRLTLRFFCAGEERAGLQLFSAQGQLLGNYPVTLNGGVTDMTLPVGWLAAGTYFLVLETGSGRMVRSFIRR
ncbi:MAG TPA: T9SS type A sorting domain-containing protein [Puia sp.]|nr:T9SS type A sorting domain-containing protein [Puia sp.]